jgi:tetratricopeptide (TPR) repeat protein
MTVAQELEAARRALSAGDERHALHHVAGALAEAPLNEVALALLWEIAGRVDVLPLAPAEGFLGYVVIRAWVLQRAQAPEALSLMAHAAQAFPDRGLELVLASWLIAWRVSRRSLSEVVRGDCLRVLARALPSTIGLHRLMPGERALLGGLFEVAEALADFPEAQKDDLTVSVLSGFRRRAGRFDAAIALASPLAATGASQSVRAKALALRAKGDGVAAAALFESLRAGDGDDVERIEEARCWYVAGDLVRAQAALATVSHRDDELSGLEALLRAPLPEDRVAALDALRREVSAHGWLSPRTDATANGLRGLPEGATGLKLAVSGWEPPSNRLCVALANRQGSNLEDVAYTQEARVLDFSPFEVEPGGLALWEPRGELVVQAVPCPPPEVLAAVAQVEAVEGDALAMSARAQALAARFEVAQASVCAHAMVYPPAEHSPHPDAVYRWQCAAALLVAWLPGPFEGPRRQTLRALALGQVDWVASAAVAALTLLARGDAEAALGARDVLVEVSKRLVPHHSEPRLAQLRFALELLPCISDEAIARVRKAVEAQAQAREPAPPEEKFTVPPLSAAVPLPPESRPAPTPAPRASGGLGGVVFAVLLVLALAVAAVGGCFR